MEVLFNLLVCLLICVLLWVTFWKKEAYPFSWYPMYAQRYLSSEVTVFRVGLRYKNGSVSWWRSKFYRYPEFIGKKLRMLYHHKADETSSIFLDMEKSRLVREVMRLISEENDHEGELEALLIIKRKMVNSKLINDVVVETIPVAQLTNGQHF